MKNEYKVDVGVTAYLIIRRQFKTPEEWEAQLESLRKTTTVYVGNLAFFTTELQIYEHFSQVGLVRRVIMGLNSITKTPCGFCFVDFYDHESALKAILYLQHSKLDGRQIRIDGDPGFTEDRRFGKSSITGGQIRDDLREDYDEDRGGYGQSLLELYKLQAILQRTGGAQLQSQQAMPQLATAGALAQSQSQAYSSSSRSRRARSMSRSRSRSYSRSRSRTRSRSRSRSSRSRSRSRSYSRSRSRSRSYSPRSRSRSRSRSSSRSYSRSRSRSYSRSRSRSRS